MKYRRYHLSSQASPAISLVLLTMLLIGAGCKRVDSNNAAQPAAVARSSPTPFNQRKLIKEDGWKIPGLAVAKEARPASLLQGVNNDSVKVYSTWLKPFPSGSSPVSLRDFWSEEQLQELGITAKKLRVLLIVKYDMGDRPFCYVVKYRSTRAIEALHYYDEDGDKDFELAERGDISPQFVPRIPKWVQH
jgi:hypothetical protein